MATSPPCDGNKNFAFVLELVLFSVLATIGAFAAYYQTFAAMKPFDDEGLLVTALRRVLAGETLYDAVPSIYGPVYFFYEAFAHRLMRVIPSNDSVRLVSSVFWVVTALLCFVLVRKLTNSVAFATVSFAGVFVFLRFLGEEPGHPQEACILLAVITVLLTTTKFNRALQMVMLGIAAALGSLCKANMGIILLLSVGWVLVLLLPALPRYKLLRFAWLFAVLAFPLVLMLPNLGMRWAQYFLFLEMCSVISLAITLTGSSFDFALKFRQFAFFLCATLVAVMAMIGVAVWQGSSIRALVDWLLFKPREIMGPLWYLGPEPSLLRSVAAIAGVFLALAVRTRLIKGRVLAGLKLSVGAGILVLTLAQRPGAVMTLGPPFLWVCLISNPSEARKRRFDRAVLCALAVTLVLYAYPVAGAQTRFVDVLLIVAAAVNLGDLTSWRTLPDMAIWRLALSAIAIISVLAFLVYTAYDGRAHYEGLEALDFPGVHRLRMEPEKVRALTALVRVARQSCSTLVTIPGMPSFNLWTGVPGFDGLRSGVSHEILRSGTWATGQDDEIQSRAVATLAERSGVCIIYNKRAMDFWIHGADVKNRPVIRFMDLKFRGVLESGDNRLLVRNPE